MLAVETESCHDNVMFGKRVEYSWDLDNSGVYLNRRRDTELATKALLFSASQEHRPGSIPAQDLLQRRFSREAVEQVGEVATPFIIDGTETPILLGALGSFAENSSRMMRHRIESLMGRISMVAYHEFNYQADDRLRSLDRE